MTTHQYALTPQELGTVLAALRFWAEAQTRPIPSAFSEIATDNGQHQAQTAEEIDALADWLNLGQEAPPQHKPAAELRSLAIQMDDYLRAIRSENLDGSEPALGELLERSYQLLTAGAPAAAEAMKEVEVCRKCGSPQLTRDASVRINTGEVSEYDDVQCQRCGDEGHSVAVTVQVPADFDVDDDLYDFATETRKA